MQEMIDRVSENDTSFREVLNTYFMKNIDEICGDLTDIFKEYLKSQSSDVFLFLLFPKFKQEQVKISDEFKTIRRHQLSGRFPSVPQTLKQKQQYTSQIKKMNRTRRGTSEPRGQLESFTLDPRGQSEFRGQSATPRPKEPVEVNEEPSWEDPNFEPLKIIP